MFYADFKHFKDFGKSITGLKYVPAPYGPVPMMYQVLLGSLIEKRKITISEIYFRGVDSKGEDIIAEQCDAAEEPLLSIFSDAELQTMLFVKKYFSSFTSRKMHSGGLVPEFIVVNLYSLRLIVFQDHVEYAFSCIIDHIDICP
jgi:hypothetical protein